MIYKRRIVAIELDKHVQFVYLDLQPTVLLNSDCFKLQHISSLSVKPWSMLEASIKTVD